MQSKIGCKKTHYQAIGILINKPTLYWKFLEAYSERLQQNRLEAKRLRTLVYICGKPTLMKFAHNFCSPITRKKQTGGTSKYVTNRQGRLSLVFIAYTTSNAFHQLLSYIFVLRITVKVLLWTKNRCPFVFLIRISTRNCEVGGRHRRWRRTWRSRILDETR